MAKLVSSRRDPNAEIPEAVKPEADNPSPLVNALGWILVLLLVMGAVAIVLAVLNLAPMNVRSR